MKHCFKFRTQRRNDNGGKTILVKTCSDIGEFQNWRQRRKNSCKNQHRRKFLNVPLRICYSKAYQRSIYPSGVVASSDLKLTFFPKKHFDSLTSFFIDFFDFFH
ncbi:hypothetical protein ACJIZ3_002263 [Penstemon smallii]|uniref:Uncharacterized protein n=1 Tax=Penstemon smallii TaxID=265156 RepID=A0ABD3U7A5_9LAMI